MKTLSNKEKIISKLLNTKSDSDLREKIISGKAKIMFSCPHSVVHYRNGNLKWDEPNTLIIANYINKTLDTPFIYKIKSDLEDANYDVKSNYKDILCGYIRKNKIKLLIDLHEMKSSRKEIINIGTNGFKNIKNICKLNCFIRVFSKNKLGLLSIDEPFAAHGKDRVSTYVHNKLNIDTVQIELNSKLFKNELDYNNILKSFKESVCELINIGENDEK